MLRCEISSRPWMKKKKTHSVSWYVMRAEAKGVGRLSRVTLAALMIIKILGRWCFHLSRVSIRTELWVHSQSFAPPPPPNPTRGGHVQRGCGNVRFPRARRVALRKIIIRWVWYCYAILAALDDSGIEWIKSMRAWQYGRDVLDKYSHRAAG